VPVVNQDKEELQLILIAHHLSNHCTSQRTLAQFKERPFSINLVSQTV